MLQAGFPCAASPDLSRERSSPEGGLLRLYNKRALAYRSKGGLAPQITKILRRYQPKNFVNIVF